MGNIVNRIVHIVTRRCAIQQLFVRHMMEQFAKVHIHKSYSIPNEIFGNVYCIKSPYSILYHPQGNN